MEQVMDFVEENQTAVINDENTFQLKAKSCHVRRYPSVDGINGDLPPDIL